MEPDKQIQQLQRQLSECLIARGGLDDDFGRLLVDLYTKHITRLTREITSDKYRKDQMGYNIALADLHAYQRLLKELQVAGSPLREEKLRERLEAKEDA